MTRGYFRGRRYLFGGRELSLYQIARLVGMPAETLRQRVLKRGMTVEDAVSCGRLPRAGGYEPRRYWFRGAHLSISDHAAVTGVSEATLRRCRSGDRIMEANEAKAADDAFRDPPANACLVTYAGQTMSIAAWARKLGVNQNTLAARLGHYEWPVDRALSTPVDPARAKQHVRRRNRRVLKTITRTFGGIKLARMGIRAWSIIPTTTGGYIRTSTIETRTGAPRHETHFEGARA